MRSQNVSPRREFLVAWTIPLIAVAVAVAGDPVRLSAQQPVIPHAQDKPPNDPRDPQTAAKLMTVPAGFTVEVVASEPNIVNPVAMAIDEKGRFWITESLEYPRRDPGPGQDRVKVLEDTDGDGSADRFTVFLDGLNIPSGIQVGHGGVWIANAPDILFVPDANRDGKPDGPAEVVVTGFGRTDTHELPNSLTWGPDGWLYGLNGVFNFCHVKYPKTNPNYEKAGGDKQPGWPITCALFRIHPRTREFQVFCEGTSNPWGIAFNHEGDAFVSACVIDHLWHLVETGYYHRQGGPYPPHTWKIESIVKHKHQKAAYCGITWFDSDAYPEQYRKKLYMGNIHGGCVNVDRIERHGSTYAGFGEPDFLTANDSWFMPVVQKTGADGCLYVLDWYDRYHCYQDANRDPKGIDRLKGRLYRVRYQNSLRAPKDLDLGRESDAQLIARLDSPNVFLRETAQRILQERTNAETTQQLLAEALDEQRPPDARRHRLFALVGRDLLDRQNWKSLAIARALLNQSDPTIRAWGIRLLTDQGLRELRRPGSVESMESDLGELVKAGLTDVDPQVRLQALIYVTQLSRDRASSATLDDALLAGLRLSGNDPVLQRTAWQAIKAFAARFGRIIPRLLSDAELQATPLGREITPRLVDWLLTQPNLEAATLTQAFQTQVQLQLPTPLLKRLAERVQSGELQGERLKSLRTALAPQLASHLKEGASRYHLDAVLLATSWRDPAGFAAAQQVIESPQFDDEQRLAAANALIAAGQKGFLTSLSKLFADRSPQTADLRGKLLASLARLDDPDVAAFTLKLYPGMEPDLQPRAIELLTQRPVWAKALLHAIGTKQLPETVINLNQARRLNDSKDAEVKQLLAKHWGVVRDGRSNDREQIVAEMRDLIRKTPGDALRGEAVFKKSCGQCHKLYGEGAEVGPDITLNGRNDYTQLLSNVFDPSLVIGAGYRSFTVATDDGRVINGLLAEDSPQRVVLKVQGGKQEIIARENIEVFKVSEISLMPEQLEKQLQPQEIADLFAYITLDKPPRDPSAKRLPGVYEVQPRETTDPADFAAVFQEVAPGFQKVSSGERGVGLLKDYRGRSTVVRTHPVSREKAAEMSGEFTIPAGKKSRLEVIVSHDSRGDWRLVVTSGNSGRLIDEMVDAKSCRDGWATFSVDLTRYAGQTIPLRLRNEANDWAYEFAYWGSVRVVSE